MCLTVYRYGEEQLKLGQPKGQRQREPARAVRDLTIRAKRGHFPSSFVLLFLLLFFSVRGRPHRMLVGTLTCLVPMHAWYSHACLVLPDGIDRSTGVQAKGCLMGASTKFDCPTLQGLVAGYGIDIILEYFRAFLSLATTFSSYLDHFSRISQLPATSTSNQC